LRLDDTDRTLSTPSRRYRHEYTTRYPACNAFGSLWYSTVTNHKLHQRRRQTVPSLLTVLCMASLRHISAAVQDLRLAADNPVVGAVKNSLFNANYATCISAMFQPRLTVRFRNRVSVDPHIYPISLSPCTLMSTTCIRPCRRRRSYALARYAPSINMHLSTAAIMAFLTYEAYG
jgi:hypothetical protein